MKSDKLYIRSLRFIGQKRKSQRLIKVGLSNGAVVKITACWEGWEQYNATTEEKRITISLAVIFNDWLHGGSFPSFEEWAERYEKPT